MRETDNLIKMKFLDEVFILGAFDGNAFRWKKKKRSFSSIKTSNTIIAKICSGSSKECNKSIKFYQGYREQTRCSQKLQSRGEEINNEKIQ